MPSGNAKIVSFSGIDGAGKSTQIETLRVYLRELGLSSKVYTFWDDVVVLSRFRERVSLSVFKGDRGVGSPDRPIVRRDKNVSSWYVIAFRLLLYMLDACHLCMMVAAPGTDADVVIFDRYIYDELANLQLRSRLARFYIRLLLKFTPGPEVAFLLDAEPEAAYVRKPEYPLEFVRDNRENYLRLARLAGMTVVPPLPIEEAKANMLASVSKLLSGCSKELPAEGCHSGGKDPIKSTMV